MLKDALGTPEEKRSFLIRFLALGWYCMLNVLFLAENPGLIRPYEPDVLQIQRKRSALRKRSAFGVSAIPAGLGPVGLPRRRTGAGTR